MTRYVVFGGVLDSPIEFPQLPESAENDTADWVIVEGAVACESGNLGYLGEHPLDDDVNVRLYRRDDGFRLHYDDSGTFDVGLDGRRIVWSRGTETDPAAVREDILGPVLAVALHVAGRVCLHGSAAVLPDGVVAFVAPKHYGKSTMALAMMERGARLLSDDSIPVEPGPPPLAGPGVASVRFWEDTRARFYEHGTTLVGAGGKRASTDLAGKAQLTGMHPLRAIYLLAPFSPDERDDPATRSRLQGTEAALTLVHHAKIGMLLGRTEAPVLLERAVALARTVPVYRLEIVRDMSRLTEVARKIADWTANDAA